jgi:SAM-dependent methyltransferase
MANEGDVCKARSRFLEKRFPNLDFLLYTRYDWMNRYIKPQTNVLEIGSGAGFSPLYIKNKLVLTDAVKNDWIEKVIDATAMDLEDNSVDVLIASHTIHHFYSPYKFFFEALRVLRADGYLLIQEINTSLVMRILLRLMRHEGYNFNADVFDPNEVVNDKNDLWSANCAVPLLLFRDHNQFEKTFSQEGYMLKCESDKPCEFLTFPLSGGVIAKTKVPALPRWILSIFWNIDTLVCKCAPGIFALGRSVVLRKVSIGTHEHSMPPPDFLPQGRREATRAH